MVNKSRTVLIIDDDLDDLETICSAIQYVDDSVGCVTFSDPVAAIAYVCNTQISGLHSIFLDLQIPKTDGFECLKTFRKESNLDGVVIAIMSSAYRDSIEEELRDSGADFVLTKPSAMEDYYEIIRVILKAHRTV